MREWLARLWDWFRRDRLEAELNEELQFHRRQSEREAAAAGSGGDEAVYVARRRLGNVIRAREEARDRWSWPWLDHLTQDIRYAIRGLRRSPGLTATIIFTLGLGVGANAAVFTVLDRVFFRAPGGVVDPGAIRRLHAHDYSKQMPWVGPSGGIWPFLAPRDLRDLGNAARGIALIEAEGECVMCKLSPSGRSVLLRFVSPGYFDLLGIRPARGRFFAPDENQLLGPPVPLAVIGDAFWRRHFASDPAILGKRVDVAGTTYTIIGVAPRVFEGLELDVVDLWAPLSNMAGGWDGPRLLKLVARVERGTNPVLLDQRLTAQYRQSHLGDPLVESKSEIFTSSILVARGPAADERGRIPGLSERSLTLLPRLAGIGLVVVVIAVANVASLLLMRAMRRRREIAVRLALGVSRSRLVAQLVIESTILAVAAGGVALFLAALTGHLLRVQLSPFLRWTETVVDQRVVLFAMAIAIMAGIAAGLAPAAFALRTDVSSSLKSSSSGATRTGSAMRTALLVTQAGLCMALLACGGSFLQSLRRAGDFDRGFDPDRAILLSIPAFYPNADEEFAQITERIRRLPGVEAAGKTVSGLSSVGLSAMVGTSAHDTVGVGRLGPSIDFIEPDLLRAAGAHLLAGRLLAASDNGAPVAVVNESLAKALWPRGHALGACFYIRSPRVVCRTVVGVVRDVVWDVSEPSILRAYLPIAQAWIAPNHAIIPNMLVVRLNATVSPADVGRLRRLIAPMIPGGDLDLSIWRLTELLEPHLRPWRLAATLFLLLGALGLAAAGTGIYGLVAYDVTQRSRELGVRIALGATSAGIIQLVVGSGLRVVLIGVAVGTVVALVTGHIMASLLFATSPYDPAVLLLTALTLSAVAALASVVPAWRAIHVDPVIALSSE